MNPQFIVSNVEVYAIPKTYYNRKKSKKIDHGVPIDVSKQYSDFIELRKNVEKNGIVHEGTVYRYNGRFIKDGSYIDSKYVPPDVFTNLLNMYHGLEYKEGVTSLYNDNLYIFTHTDLEYVQNEIGLVNELYNESWPKIQKIINSVGKPVRFNDIFDDDLHFCTYTFKVQMIEQRPRGTISSLDVILDYCKLTLTDLEGEKIVKMCTQHDCHAYESENVFSATMKYLK